MKYFQSNCTCSACGKNVSNEELFWFTYDLGFCNNCKGNLHKIPFETLMSCRNSIKGGNTKKANFIINVANGTL